MNNDEKGFRSCQECLDAVNEERSNKLKDHVPYKGPLNYLKASTTYNTQIPTVDFGYLINGIVVVDTYVFDLSNPKYLKFTMNRLAETLELYGETLKEFTDTKTFVEKYQHLVGTQVKIKQDHYKDFPKYQILATEKTSKLD